MPASANRRLTFHPLLLGTEEKPACFSSQFVVVAAALNKRIVAV
jgi:hypothetical protein